MLETLGQRALILRKDLSYSQRDVVDYLKGYSVEIDYSHYSRIQNDKALPSIPVLIGMAKVLGCTTDYLLTLSDEPQARKGPTDVFLTPEANQIGDLVDSMDEDMRQHALHNTQVLRTIDTERRELHSEIAELLMEQISLLSGQKQKRVSSLLTRLGF